MKLEIVSKKVIAQQRNKLNAIWVEKFVHSIHWNGRQPKPIQFKSCNPLFFSFLFASFCSVSGKSMREQSSDSRTSQISISHEYVSIWNQYVHRSTRHFCFALSTCYLILLHFRIFRYAQCDQLEQSRCRANTHHTHTKTRANLNDAFTNFYWFCHERAEEKIPKRKRSAINRGNVCVCHHCCRRVIIVCEECIENCKENKYQIQNAQHILIHNG